MINNTPLVAIYCIAYNESEYIRRTLDGFVMQITNFPFVAIVHDDASTDGTDTIIREYAVKYPKIIKGHFEETGSNLFSRHILDEQMNKWLFATGCKYIAYCEGDDFWIDPYKLQKQVDYMEANPKCVLCYTDCHVANDEGEITTHNLISKHLLIPRNFEEHLLNAGYIAPPTWLYRRDVSERLGSYDRFIDTTFVLALDLFKQGDVHYMDEPTAVYTVRENSMANQMDAKEHWQYMKTIGETQLLMADKYGCAEEVKQRILFQRYVTDMSLAIEAEDEEYVNEALAYFNQKGYIMKWFVESCRTSVRYKRQYEQIRASKAYRLGKLLLTPFKWMRRICYHSNTELIFRIGFKHLSSLDLRRNRMHFVYPNVYKKRGIRL